MLFSNPLLFWGLAATVAVPIVLHLIMRQSPKHVVFPALRFLRQRNEANRRRLRFRHLLLLALRTAVLLFLAAALCRPSIGCSGIRKSKDAPVSAAIVVDTSPSMLYEQQNQTRLELAQDTVGWLLTKLPDESQVALLDSATEAAVFEVDVPQARERLEQLQVTTTPNRLLNVAARAIELLKSGKHEAKELYLFTDRSRGEWSPEFSGQLIDQLAAMPNVGVYVIDVGSQAPQNTALGELRLSGEVVARNATIQLEQVVSRIGGEFSSQIDVILRDSDGKEIPQEPANVSLGSDDRQSVPIRLSRLREPGTYQGEIRIVKDSGNLLSVDDRRYFTIEVKHAWPVLLAAPAPVEAYAWDLRQFLEPWRHRYERRQRFECTLKTLEELELPATKLADYGAVCLLDPGPLPQAVWDKLATYVRSGGSLAIFLGRNAVPDTTSFNTPSAQALLAGHLQGTMDWASTPVFLDPKPEKHEMLTYFGQLEEPLPWRAFWVRRAWRLQPLHADASKRQVIQFTNGLPAVLERRIGQGRVITMTTPVSDDPQDEEAWCSLPWTVTEANGSPIPPRPFMALANEMMRYLVGAYDEQFNCVAGQTVRLVLEPGKTIEQYKLLPPSGEADASFPRTDDPNKPLIQLTSLKQIGNYKVQLIEEGLNRGFSVNLDAQESILARAGDDDVKGIFGETPFSLARDREEINRKLTETRVGHELFPLLIALVAMILGAEHVLANRFYRDEQADDESDSTIHNGEREALASR